MKVSLPHREPEDFKPIKLEVVIETKNELLELWYRLNMSINKVREDASEKDAPLPLPSSFSSIPALWNFIDKNFVRPKKQ